MSNSLITYLYHSAYSISHQFLKYMLLKTSSTKLTKLHTEPLGVLDYHMEDLLEEKILFSHSICER